MIGAIVWITGLPRAGKTTIARQIAIDTRLPARAVHLDGDALREILPVTAGHSPDERRALAHFYAGLAAQLAHQGHIVVCSTVSLFREVQELNRASGVLYLEVLVEASDAVRRARDDSGVYHAQTNVMGRDIVPEFPISPDLVITNEGDLQQEDLASEVVNTLIERLSVPRAVAALR